MNTDIIINPQYNQYPEIITINEHNPTVSSPYAETDLPFYQNKDTIFDVDHFRYFLKNSEMRFRQSREYKAYKSYLIEYLGIDRCQILGNVTNEDAEIELHHNVLGLFDIALMITLHTINTVGIITSFDLIELLIQEHFQNNVGITFLSKTMHQVFTNDPNAYIPPEMTFGAWWNLLYKYKYGITFEIANKVLKYIKKYQERIPCSLNPEIQDEILNFANFNEYGTPEEYCNTFPAIADGTVKETNTYDNQFIM